MPHSFPRLLAELIKTNNNQIAGKQNKMLQINIATNFRIITGNIRNNNYLNNSGLTMRCRLFVSVRRGNQRQRQDRKPWSRELSRVAAAVTRKRMEEQQHRDVPTVGMDHVIIQGATTNFNDIISLFSSLRRMGNGRLHTCGNNLLSKLHEL
jgi:hypothetical protein